MGGGGGDVEAPDVVGAARVEAEANRIAAQNELWGNRPDQTNPFGSSTWTTQMTDANTGRPIHKDEWGDWQFSDAPVGDVEPEDGHPWGAEDGYQERQRAANIDAVNSWSQDTTLNDEWQEVLDGRRGVINDKSAGQSQMLEGWAQGNNDFSDIGGSNLKGTITKGELAAYGQNAPNMGAQDWRQFGTTDQTISAGQWQNQGNSDPTIGADDWRQFGTTGQTVNSGDWDARFGGNDQSGGFGDHGMGNSEWDTVQYTPEALRNKAEQQTLDFMNSQLDPQWATKQNDLEVQLANKGLQAGDAQYDNAMASMSRNRNSAYAGARNQALADSRAEANMLWGQEMQRSEQKNSQTQADLDNVYRARQSNIQNYQGQRQVDMQGYLDYQNSAFDQDYRSRQQQLNANLDYGNSAFQQDFSSRQQSLDAQLNYGREAFGQDFQGRQQQLDANRLYSQEAFNQDLQSRQANISNALNFGREEFQQGLSQQELDLRARIAQEQLDQSRFGLMDPNQDISTVANALG